MGAELPDTIFIRADCSVQRGMGHVVRMTVLAEELRSIGFRVVFLSMSLEGLGRALVKEAGFRVRLLDSPPGAEEDLSPQEAAGVASLLREGRAGLVVDHYGVTTEYLEVVGRAAGMLASTDDLANRHYPVDLVVNGNLGAETFEIDARTGTLILAGADYALLRVQFARERASRSAAPVRPGRVLVVLGGSDPQRLTGRFVRLLRDDARKLKYEIHVVLGRGVEYPEGIESGIFIHRDVRDIARLFAQMSFCFTAGGSTVLELACLGVPAAIVIVSDDQTRVAEEGERSGAFFNLGWYDELADEKIGKTFRRLAGEEALLQEMSRKGLDLVDGQGAARVAQRIRGLFDQRVGN